MQYKHHVVNAGIAGIAAGNTRVPGISVMASDSLCGL